MTYSDQALEIVQGTRDGNDLAPEHLKLVELCVNGWLSEAGEVAFAELYANVTKPKGYTRPWLHGIEHLTKDHAGFVYWKGRAVEHYSFYGDDAFEHEKAAAEEIARRCRILEARSEPISTSSVVWRWEE